MVDSVVGRIRARPVTSAFVILTATAFIVLAVLGWSIRQNRELAREGAEAHAALCVFKNDLARRIAVTQDFIDAPPKTIFGIPVTAELIAQAQTQLDGQTATFDSLSTLAC